MARKTLSLAAQRGSKQAREQFFARRMRFEQLEDRRVLAVFTWDGNSDGDGDGISWSDPLNWTADSSFPNSTADTATFANNDVGLVNINGLFTVGTVNLNNTAGSYVFSAVGAANALTIDNGALGGTVSQTNGVTNTFSDGLILPNATSFAVAAGTLNVNASAVGDEISGAGGISKSGAGTLQLGGTVANTFVGGVTLTAGILDINNNGALGTGTFTINGGTIQSTTGARSLNNSVNIGGDFAVGSTNNITLANGGAGSINLQGSTRTVTVTNSSPTLFFDSPVSNGALSKAGAGRLALNRANTFAGGATVSAGILSFGNDAAAGTGTLTTNGGNVQADGATRTLANAVTVGGDFGITGTQSLVLSGNMNLTGGVTRTVSVTSSSAATFGGVVGGTGGLTKDGVGTLLLTNTNNYAGATGVNGGTLQIQNGAAIPDGSAVSVGSAGTLQLLSSETVASFSGAAGSSLILGANTLTTTGGMAIAGVTTAGGGLTAGTAITDNNAGTLNISGTSITLQAATGIGSGDALETSLDSVVATTSGVGAIQLSEANAIALTNVATTTGAITISVTGAGDVTAENVNAGAAAVNISLADGDLLSGGADPGVADIVGGTVTLDVTGGNSNNFGNGVGNRLELNAVTLHAGIASSGTNTAFIVDTAGGVTMADSSIGAAVNSTYNLLVQSGSLLSGTPGTRDVGATVIVLQVTGVGSTIGTAAQAFEINSPVATAGARVDASTPGGLGENIFISDLADSLPVGTINAGAANVVLRATAGGITDANGASNNVVAASLALRALSGGIGSSDALETKVSVLSAENTSSGDIQVANTVGGLLTIQNLAPVTAPFGIRNQGGSVTISNASPLTVAANVVASGAITLTAGELGAVGDDLVVNSGVTIQSLGSTVTLSAGDNATINSAVLLAAATNITINIDFGNADAAGATLLIDSTADLDGAAAFLNGDSNNDTFTLRPDDDATNNLGLNVNTPITVNGFAPTTFPGDKLNLDINGLTSPTLTVNGVNSGAWSFGNAAPVTYISIEEVMTTPAASCYGLILDMNGALGTANGAAADTIVAQVNGANLELIVNGGAPVFSGPQATIDSLTVLGSADDDTLNVNESPGGLPVFCMPTTGPATGHTSSTFTTLTGYNQAGTTPVDIQFTGGGGVDQLQLNLTATHAVVYTSDNLDSGKSGNVGIGSGGAFPAFGTPQLGISFAGLSPLIVIGAGGTFTADASSSPVGDVTSLTIDDAPGAGTTSIAPNAGSATFEPATISGFAGLVVRGGAGPQTVDLANIDAASGLTNIVLDADNLTNTDTSDDTVRVQSTNGLPATVRLLAGQGNDTFQVLKTTAVTTIDGIAGQVFVSPIAGPFTDDPAAADGDSLFVSDTGDATGDNVSIRETSIEGITSFAGSPDIDYRNIDTLDLTGTAGNDVFDTVLNSGSDLDVVRVNGFDGNDQFYLDLNTADDLTNIVTGLASVTFSGDGGSDVFGQTPDNAPHAVTGLPALPLPPAPLEMPHFTPPAFPGVNRFKIRPSQSTVVNINGGLNNSATALAPAFNATQGNEFGAAFDLLNLDLTDRRPVAQSNNSVAIVSTVSGFATTSDPDPGESFQAINFTTTEAINLCDQGYLTRVQMGDLYIRTTEFNDVVQFNRTNDPIVYRTRVNTQFFNLAATRKTVVYGRGGNDTIQQVNVTLPAEFYGQAGDDYLSGYIGNDLLVGGYGKDRLIGQEGVNELWGDEYPQEGVPFENLGEGGDNDDQISGGSLADTIYGQGGNDVISAAGGDDYVSGGSGDDNISGAAGNDRLYGGDGNDTLGGDDGDDLLAGNAGNDRLYGRAGNDVLIGGTGNDILDGGDGNDLIYDGVVTGGGGASDASVTKGDASDVLMQALLNDWVLDNILSAPSLALSHPHDGAIDAVLGGLGIDLASPGPEDTGDWDATLP